MKRFALGAVLALSALVVGFGALRQGDPPRAARDGAIRDAASSALGVDEPVRGADGRLLPPPLPVPGTRDSIVALVIAPDTMLATHETRESEYEVKALTVYGRSAEHYLVAKVDGTREWVHRADVGAEHGVEQLVVNRLNYLTRSWDRTLRTQPGFDVTAAPVSLAQPDAREVPAEVVEVRYLPDGIWVLVDVLATNPCEGGDSTVKARGWIPLWGRDAGLTAWFYSRGC